MITGISPEARLHLFIIRVGLFFFPVFFFLDIFVYPNYTRPLLIIRAIMFAYLVISYFIVKKTRDNPSMLHTLLTIFLASFAISFMCFITKDGFASPYYAGLFLVLVATAACYRMKKRSYIILLGGIIAQHILLLSFIPFTIRDILIDIFFLVSSCVIAIFIYNTIYRLGTELSSIKKFLPICANCKSIKDKHGNWHRVEEYLSESSEAAITHGFCPHCLEKIRHNSLQ